MVEPRVRRPTVVVLGFVVAMLLIASSATLYLRRAPQQVTVDDAVASFRASTPAAPSTTSEPEPSPQSEAGSEAPATIAPDPSAGPASAPPATSVPAAAAAPSAPHHGEATPAARPSPAPPAGERPETEEGVYTFTTVGYESTNALGGARHDYPPQTPVTLRRTDCGVTMRWQPLQERWDESALCHSDAGLAIQRFTTYHEFFQRGQQQRFECPPSSDVFRWNPSAGATWGWRCTAGESAIETKVTVIGEEHVEVEGVGVPAVRHRYESKMSGANRGTQLQERWIRPSDGLNLRIKTDIEAEADSPFGAVHYEEHYTITIASLRPRR